MTTIDLDEIDITGIDQHPPDASVKLYGPPGTGKTTQSAARVARLLKDYGYEISDVAWCTYRRSLATETLGKLASWGVIDPEELEDPTDGDTRHIATFHAVANRVIGGIGDMVSGYDKRQFCGYRNIRYESKSAWDDPPGQLLFDVLTFMANNLLDPTNPADVNEVPQIDRLRAKWTGDLGEVWEDWQQFKQERGIHDFHEQLKRPLELGRSPNADVLVVDEYHDATPLMAELAELWMQDADVVIFAGDPDQVVNNYAGADPVYFERIGLPEVLLDTTYRVPYEHWEVASNVLRKGRVPPAVERNSTGGFGEATSPPFTHSQEGGWSVPAPEEQYSPVWFLETHGSDTMFLTRTRKQADGVAYALEKAGVLYRTQASMNRDGWEEPNGDETNKRTAIYNALQKIRHLKQSDFSSGGLSNFGDGTGTDPERVVLEAHEAAALMDHTNHRYLDQSREDTTAAAESLLQAEESLTAREFAEYVTEEFWHHHTNTARSVGYLNKAGNVRGNLTDRDLEALKPALDRNTGPVGDVETKVFTIHASKGSEAENVVVWDGVTSRIAGEMDRREETRENEWRTWYVALTRASDRLFVLRDGFDWTEPILPDTLVEWAADGHEAANEGVAT